MMRIAFYLFLFCLSSTMLFAQENKPEKILKYKDPKRLEKLMISKGWKELPTLTDATDADRYLFRKKTPAKGYAYMGVILGEMMHYQVYFSKKKDYEKTMDYNEFLVIPESKSEYCNVVENDMLQFKSINIYDPDDSRNLNMFYGRMNQKKLEALYRHYHKRYIEQRDSTLNEIDKKLDREKE